MKRSVASPTNVGRAAPLKAVRSWMIAGAIALAALLVHARVIAGQTWDDVDYHVHVAPPRLAAAAQIQAGTFPRWWDGASWGVPLWAEPSHGAGAPLGWLAPSPHGLDLVLVLYAALLAMGVGLWAARAGASASAAIAAGVLVATTGIVTSAALRGVLPAIAPLPWIGWAALGLERTAEGGARSHDRRYAALVAVFLGMAALGGDFAAVIDGVAIAMLAGGSRRSLGVLAGALAAGLAIGAALWLPALAFHGAGAEVHGIRLTRLLELFVPGAFGSANPLRGITAIGGGAAGAWPSLFVGAPLLGLALAYRVGWRLRALTIGAAMLALVVGRGGWPAGLGTPEVHAAALVIALAVRAARGIDGVLAGERRARIALGITAAAAFVATWFAIALRDANAAAADRALLDGGIGVALLVAAFALARRVPRVAVVLALLPGVVAMRSTEPTIDSTALDQQPRWVTDGLAMFPKPPRRVYRPPVLAQKGATPLPDGVLSDALATLAGESAARFGIAAALTEDPARSPHADAAFAASAHNGGQLFERMSIALAVLPEAVASKTGMRELDPASVLLGSDAGQWSLTQYPATPPAVTLSDWDWVPDADAAFKELFPVDGTRGVPLDRGVFVGSGAAPDAGGIHHANTCDIARWDDAEIDLACSSPSGAYAVVSSSAAAGWTCAVDGSPTPWVVVDGLRRAVYVTKGKHQIRWRYETPALDAAIAIAVVGLLLVGALAGFGSRRTPAR